MVLKVSFNYNGITVISIRKMRLAQFQKKEFSQRF